MYGHMLSFGGFAQVTENYYALHDEQLYRYLRMLNTNKYHIQKR